MSHKILLSPQELQAELVSNTCLIFDCRFVLSDPGSGHRDYLEAHIPGAVYAHLDDDLSGPVTRFSGRHPLPEAQVFAAFLARSGWQPGARLVAYDHADGSIAARLWWLMKYFGHDCAALLDGGFRAWHSAGYELESGQVTAARAVPVGLRANADLVVSTAEILDGLGGDDRVLTDVRAGERFRGEFEPIDPVAGHVPGAVNYPFQLNLTAEGRFKAVEDIRAGLQTLAENHHATDLVYMCGSGVTACHTIFAGELAGLEQSKLYAGSWSEWIRDPSRPVEP
jgi:thiosulfate/3-mercaptopyruvate sulfurtransferase